MQLPRPLWVSPMTCPVRLGVSPAAAPTPMGVFNQRFEALFPRAGALGYVFSYDPRHLSHLSVRECGAALPAPFSTTLIPAHSVYLRECGAAGAASGQTACPVGPTLCQSQSCHGSASPLSPSCPFPPLLPVWMYVSFLSTCCNSLLFDFLPVLVVRGGAVCLPMPPSWFSAPVAFKTHPSLFLSYPTSWKIFRKALTLPVWC